MINRDIQTVSVVSFTSGKDAYGQKRKNGKSYREIDMFVKIYQQTNTSDIRYVDVNVIGLTSDRTITTANQIMIGEETFDVLYVIPSRRYVQVLMKRV